MPYVVGYNTPGYLPESDPYICEDADSAKRALIDDMLRHADTDSRSDPDSEALSAELTLAAEDLNLTDVSEGYSVTICDPEREHDLGTHYWIDGPNPYPYDR